MPAEQTLQHVVHKRLKLYTCIRWLSSHQIFCNSWVVSIVGRMVSIVGRVVSLNVLLREHQTYKQFKGTYGKQFQYRIPRPPDAAPASVIKATARYGHIFRVLRKQAEQDNGATNNKLTYIMRILCNHKKHTYNFIALISSYRQTIGMKLENLISHTLITQK